MGRASEDKKNLENYDLASYVVRHESNKTP